MGHPTAGTDPLALAVRHQVRLGRLLPLGTARDGSWIAERAAAGVLREHAEAEHGVRVRRLRIAAADLGEAREPAVPPPASGLPPGPLRVELDVAVPLAVCAPRFPAVGAPAAGGSLRELAAGLREGLLRAAGGRLGLEAVAADVRVVELLEEAGPPAPPEEAAAGASPGGALTRAGLAVPGVRGLQTVGDAAAPDGHVEVRLLVARTPRTVEVARAAREAVGAAASARAGGPVTVTAVVVGLTG